jgi:hypothetical protein
MMAKLLGLHCFAPLVLVVSLSGCALNALRVEYAGNVGDAGQVASAGAREFLTLAAQTREEANIEIIVADPACGQPGAIFKNDLTVTSTTSRTGDFCRKITPQDDPKTVTRFSTIDPTEDLAPALDLINVLVDYTDTLADIAAEEPVDATKRIDQTLETASALEDAFSALLGRQGGATPAPDDPRVVAIKGFLGLVLALKKEADQVTQLRAVLADNPNGAKPMIGALRRSLSAWEGSRKNDSLLRLGVAKVLAKRVLDAVPPSKPAERREALRTEYSARAKARAEDRFHPAVVRMLAELESADADFRRVIIKDPALTKAERRKLAELTRQRVVGALQTFTALVKAF